MEGTITLGRKERKEALRVYRSHPDPAVCKRAQIILLLAAGWSWSHVRSAMFCSSRTIDRWQKRYQEDGLEALLSDGRGRRRPANDLSPGVGRPIGAYLEIAANPDWGPG